MLNVEFRGYAVDEMVGSQWVYGTGVHRTKFTEEFAKECGQDGESFIFTESGWICVHDESIGQFAYRNDVDGEKVFDGDYFIEAGGDVGIVKFKDDGFKIVWYGYEDILSEGGWNEGGGDFTIIDEDYISGYYIGQMKKAGNLFENNKWGNSIK